jgi:capsular exopolysaccharide synthesis family protein
MELVKLYTALLRRRWLVVQSVSFFVLAALALALLLPKNYKASARVLVSSSDAAMSILSDIGLQEVAAGMSSGADDIQNTITLATTRPVLDAVIWKLQLRDAEGGLLSAEAFLVPGMFGELEARANIKLSQQQGSEMLIFEARSHDPELSRLIADTVVQVAISKSQERARMETRSARVFIMEQLDVVHDEFDFAMSEIADAQSAEKVIDLDAEVRAAIARISQLMLAFEHNSAAIQELQSKISSQRAYQEREDVDSLSPVSMGSNAKISLLTERIEGLKQERAKALTTKTDKHPDVLRLVSLLGSTRGELDLAIREQHRMDPTVHNLRSELSGLRTKGAQISESIDRTTREFSLYPDKMRRIGQLKLAAAAAEDVYKSLQEQRFQVGVAEAMAVSDLKFIEPAKSPERHASPKLLVNLLLGLFLGVGFGGGLVFLFEYVDDTIKSPDDLRGIWAVPRLGIVPNQRDGAPTIADRTATDPLTESYRTIRNSLVFASVDKPVQLLAVTSAVPGEGKSTVASNLAVSFAAEGKRTVLVDCDLRRPSQHRLYPSVSNHLGLTDVLSGQVETQKAIQETPVTGLSLLTSGKLPDDPGRLIESLRLRQLLLDLRRNFDVVVVDTPPVLVVNDALIIARAVDGIAIVVESGKTSRKLVSDLRGQCEGAGIEPLGVIVNKMDFFTTGYGAYMRAYAAYARMDDQNHPPSAAPSTKGGVA